MLISLSFLCAPTFINVRVAASIRRTWCTFPFERMTEISVCTEHWTWVMWGSSALARTIFFWFWFWTIQAICTTALLSFIFYIYKRCRQPGLPISVLPNDIEFMCKRAYNTMQPAVQRELVRISSCRHKEHWVYTLLAYPTTMYDGSGEKDA